jgi:hypothetical protein
LALITGNKNHPILHLSFLFWLLVYYSRKEVLWEPPVPVWGVSTVNG